MKNSLKTALSAVVGAAVMSCCAFSAAAADVELEFLEKESNGAWGQSVVYYTAANPSGGANAFDPCTMTEESEVYVEYTCGNEDGNNHIELVWQSWGDHVTPVVDWAKITPYEYGIGYSKFAYADIVTAYGSDDFSEVYAINVGDTGIPVTVTKVVITNTTSEEAAVTEESAAETEEAAAVTEEAAATEKSEETEAAAETEKAEKKTEAKTEAAEESKPETAAAPVEPAPAPDNSFAGIVLIILIVIVSAAIIFIVFLMMRNGKGMGSGKQ